MVRKNFMKPFAYSLLINSIHIVILFLYYFTSVVFSIPYKLGLALWAFLFLSIIGTIIVLLVYIVKGLKTIRDRNLSNKVLKSSGHLALLLILAIFYLCFYILVFSIYVKITV